MLRRSTCTVSGVVDVKRVVLSSGTLFGVGYGKYRCVASTNESVVFATASAGSEDVVKCGGFDAARDVRRRTRGSLFDMLAVLHARFV